MMTLQSVYSEVEGCIIFTVIVLLGDESLLPHYVVAAAFAPTELPIYSAALVSFFPVHHPSNPITVCDSVLSTVRRHKKKKVHK